MADVSWVQTSFAGGAWSPFMYGRLDDPRYKTAMAICLNSFPLEEGCWTRRPGTKFVMTTKVNGDASRLIPFVYSNIQAYILQLGDSYFRIIKNDALFVDPPVSVIDTSSANPAVVHTSAPSGYSTGNHVVFSLRDFTNALKPGLWNGRQFTVTVVDATHFSIGVNGAIGSQSTTNGGSVFRIVEVATPWTAAQLPALKYAQDLNTLYVFHPNVHTRVITRNASEVFSIASTDFLDGPYLDPGLSGQTVTPGAVTGTTTFTFSGTTDINSGLGWQSGDVGRLFRIKDSAGNWTWVQVTVVTDTTHVTGTIRGPNLADTSARSVWRMGAYSDYIGWPSCGVFHEGRLWLNGNSASPNALYSSKSGLPNDFTPTSADGTIANDNGISLVFNAHDANPIVWLASDDHGLVAGTLSGTWVVRASTLDDPLTPTSVQARRVSEFGCADSLPQHLPLTILFVEAQRRKLYDFSYNVYYGNYKAENVAKTSIHLTVSGIQELNYQHNPLPTVWLRKADGTLAGVTYDKAESGITQVQTLAGWHQHVPGANGTGAFIESLATVPTADGLSEELYLSVRRFLGGTNVRTIERVTHLFDDTLTQAQAYFVDGGFQLTIVPVGESGGVWASTFTAPAYFYAIGETLDIMVEGYDMGSATVDANGSILVPIPIEFQGLSTTLTNVFIGYSYTSQGQLLRPEEGGENGPAIGKKRRVDQYSAQLHRTFGMSFGTDFTHLTAMEPVNLADSLNNSVALSLTPLHSLMFTDSIDDDMSFEGQICWQQTRPFPGTVLSMSGFLSTFDK